MKKSKILIIISVITILTIVSAVFVYLYIATDIFKSDNELFGKYISQDIESLNKMTKLKSSEIYRNLKYENKYESNINIKAVHSEGGEISNPLNNLEAKIEIQKNNEEQYFYTNAQILFANEEYIEAEIIKEKELYGIRFSDVVKQFITIKDDEQFETVANNIGITSDNLKKIINVIDVVAGENESVVVSEEIKLLKDKCLDIIKNTVMQGKFDSLKDAMITYNNQTIKTNAYFVELSGEQIQSIIDKQEFEKIIDDKTKKIIEKYMLSGVKITVYEQKGKTIRTVIESDSNKIILEKFDVNGENKINIQLDILDGEQMLQYNILLSKNTLENAENFEMKIQLEDDETLNEISFLNEIKLEENSYELKTVIGHTENITTQSIVIENIITTGNDFEKKQKLEQGNNVILNNLVEERQQVIINALKENIPQKIQTRLNLLKEALTIKEEVSESNGNEMSLIDINKFNAKFEFYAGESVSPDNVKSLLDIVKNNVANCEIIPVANETENISENQKYNFKLSIEKDNINEDAINKIKEKLEDKKKYKVSIFYKQQDGLIDYIMINEIEK